jgi:hypothetical protein
MAQVFSLAEVYNQLDQARAAEDRHTAAGYENERSKRELGDDDVLRNSVREAIGEDGIYQPEMHAAALEKAGRGDLAHKLRQDATADAQKMIDWINSSLPYVNERNYPKIRKMAAESGIDLPEQYDKAELDRMAQEVLTRSERVVKWGKPGQIPGANPGTVGQENLETGQYDVLDYTRYSPYGRGGKGGSGGTGRERIIDRIMESLGGDSDENFMAALELERRSQTMDPEKFYRDVALVSMRQYDTTGKANEKALELTRALYPGWNPGDATGPRPEPAPPPQPNPKYDPMGILNR